MRQQVRLQLATGERLTGQLIGAALRASGELVFTTGLVGYTEALTDPSYFGQILVFSYPLIGNYGVPQMPASEESLLQAQGFESSKVYASAVIVACDSPQAYHWTSHQSLDAWLKDQGVPGIVGLDTRYLVHRIRNSSGLLAGISPAAPEGDRYLGHINTFRSEAFFDPNQQAIVQEVSREEPYILGKGKLRIALLDMGVKWNIVRQLVGSGCEVQLLPWDSKVEQIDCSGWLLSNGPGNPELTGPALASTRSLLAQSRPLLAICLGHQLLSMAAGLKAERMPYGHRSHNQPVYLIGSHKAYITSQNHGYMISDAVLPSGWEVWFRNVNDHSIEGLRHQERPFRSVQFHPESAGGPRDTAWIIEQFVGEVKRYARTN